MRLAGLLGFVATLLLVGCALRQAQGDTGLPQGVLRQAQGDTAPDAKSGDLLYVSDQSNYSLDVFSYPKGVPVGTITDVPEPQGECVDKKGDVFVTTFQNAEILEYAHGGTSPIATLSNSGEYMEGCAVDPKTGDLAVMDFETTSGGSASVAIFKKAKGTPTVLSDSNLLLGYALTYDDKGNIFLDGLDGSRNFEFAELPKGSSSFTIISLNATIGTPGGMQFDGKYVDVGDAKGGEIYQTNGAGGQIESTISLGGTDGIFQYVVDGKRVAGANVYSADVDLWAYPAGGTPTKTLTGFSSPFGVAVSPGRK